MSNDPVFSEMAGCANGDFVTVYSSAQTANNAFNVNRYDADGNLIWYIEFYNSSVDYSGGSDIIEASNGDILVSTSSLNTSTNRLSVGLFRINSAGALLWEKEYSSGGPSGFDLGGNSKLVEASDGSIYLATDESNFPSAEAIILLRFSASGNLLWGKTFGTSPRQQLATINEAPASGVHIGAQNVPGNDVNLFTIDSAGTLVSSKQCAQWGFLQAIVTDSAKSIKALLLWNSASANRLVELDSAGNISQARWSPFSTQPFTNALFYHSGGYVSVHGNNTFGTRLCNWSASPSVNNGINYADSTTFSAEAFFQISDGSIYLAGESTDYYKTRIIKTNPMSGTDFQFGGCTQVSTNYTLYSINLSNPVPFAVTLSPYTPVNEVSSLSTQLMLATVTDNCINQVSVAENSEAVINVYPNPASDVLAIELNFSGNALAEIIAVDGRTVMRVSVPSGSSGRQLDISNLPEGIYQVRITDSANKPHTAKLVVNR
ncbi:MAG: T9SS type A sorting domain-containing protein [Bacteroidetes bacterium]|nr:T9SS type A sorting domain-containing protein [Bacteroidota bacterium]